MCLFHFPYTLPLLFLPRPPFPRPNPPRILAESSRIPACATRERSAQDANNRLERRWILDGVGFHSEGDGGTRWLKRRFFVLDTVFVLTFFFLFFFLFFFFFWTNVSFDLSLRLDGVRSSRGVNSEKSLCFFVNFSN